MMMTDLSSMSLTEYKYASRIYNLFVQKLTAYQYLDK